MEHRKRSQGQQISDVQETNRQWWTDETMSYDWNEKIPFERFTCEWFDEVDRRFIHGARLFAHEKTPFDRLLPLSQLKGKRVLEIGCGMGLHSELIVRAGAKLVAIDISETSVHATKARMRLKGLGADVRQMDAVEMTFPDETFDFVWSWGVIHHSAFTGRIVRQIERVLRPGCEARVMVYHLGGTPAYLVIALQYLVGFWKGKRLDDLLWQKADGVMARYYTHDGLADLFHTFFEQVEINVYGQDADGLPLPRHLRKPLMRVFPEATLARWANKRGGLIQAIAIKSACTPK
jgi:2-polyprenyl-3-methyl-5-hydroxy-6-metoxy-1,4-benzoquinol methylase